MTNRAFKTGESRQQPSLLPPRIEDYVGPDNPVRAIESFVCALDLGKLGFRHADRGVEAMGQPPYDDGQISSIFLELASPPRREARESHARKLQFTEAIQADLGRPVLLQKIFRLTRRANHA